MEPVCGKCGDKGFAVALVCCVMCKDAYEHRYCFNKASDIFREDIKWACEECLPSIPKKCTIKKTRILPSRRSERLSAKNLPTEDAGIAAKPARSSANAKRIMQRSKSSLTTEHLELKNVSTKNNQRHKCTIADSENESAEVPSELERKPCELLKRKLSNLEAEDCTGGTLWIDMPGLPTSHEDLHAQPIKEPIWKGSFRVSNKRFCKVEGVAAHLSTLASPKAQQEASLLPAILHPDMVPRSTVWPKSFREAGPNDGSIGLYFLTENDRNGEAFDSLVDEMITNDLAMSYVVEKAELLVFTSLKLPFDYWMCAGSRSHRSDVSSLLQRLPVFVLPSPATFPVLLFPRETVTNPFPLQVFL